MTSVSPALPPSLVPWAGTLSVLRPELAVELGPLLRGLDRLFAARDYVAAEHGETDGYAGLARRGDPTRLVMSEWALAEAMPLEFLRRAAGAELLHLAPAYREQTGRGRLAVLVDTGPDQLGPGRLVQLAALIVLHRRAAARGTQLVLGVLGDADPLWQDGQAEAQLRRWLGARRAETPTAEDVERWTSTAANDDEVWVIAGRRLGEALPGRPRTVVSRESAWSAAGATTVEVRLDGDRLELALPHGPVAVHALRGAAFRESALPAPTTGLRFPGFPSATPALLARGRTAVEIVTVNLSNAHVGVVRPRRHAYPGPVVCASILGRRTVALIDTGDALRVEVHGKPLASLDGLTVPHEQLELDRSDVARLVNAAPGRLFLHGANLLAECGTAWWLLHPLLEPTVTSYRAVGPGEQLHQPRVAWHDDDGDVWIDGYSGPAADAQVLLGPGTAAWDAGDSTWSVGEDEVAVGVPTGDTVLGVVVLDDEPALLTRSAAGLVLRLRWPERVRTLTRWSQLADDAMSTPAVHPQRPWLTFPRPGGGLMVVDLATDSVLAELTGEDP